MELRSLKPHGEAKKEKDTTSVAGRKNSYFNSQVVNLFRGKGLSFTPKEIGDSSHGILRK